MNALAEVDYARHRNRPRRLGHAGPCGARVACWLERCQARFGIYAPVEVLFDPLGRIRLVLARCHHGAYRGSELPPGAGAHVWTALELADAAAA